MKHLVQALPENRLATLLAQESFQEAEEIAKRFNLDAEVCMCVCDIPVYLLAPYIVEFPTLYGR